MIKLLQISGYESPGRRFNGLSIKHLLKMRGVDSTHLVWAKDSTDPTVLSWKAADGAPSQFYRSFYDYLRNRKWFDWELRLGRRRTSLRKLVAIAERFSLTHSLNWVANTLESVLSLQSVLYINTVFLSRMRAYTEADLVHLHIIHSGYFGLWALPEISRDKPTIWTLHDPWAMTGHCIYPFECLRWKTGCGDCPNLKSSIPLRTDRTALLFRYKKRVYARSKLDIIVASKWMLNMVRASPMFEGVPVHHVPFGIDLRFFSESAAPNARARFGISTEALVICFRSDTNEFKGLKYIVSVLERIRSDQPVCLLTFSMQGLMSRFCNQFQVVELGWVNDEEISRDAFVAADIFLMPSTAEAFGVMAIEAMACGRPVISFEGTSLPEITYAPEVGVSVPMHDSEALLDALQRLIDRPAERIERGRLSRLMAEQHYDAEVQADRLASIYRGAVSR